MSSSYTTGRACLTLFPFTLPYSNLVAKSQARGICLAILTDFFLPKTQGGFINFLYTFL